MAVSVIASTLLTFALRPVLGEHAHYLTFTLAVIACSWYGGLLPGLAATITGFLSADYFFIEPLYSIFPVEPDDVAMLAAVGVSVSVLTERLASARTKLDVATAAAGVGIFDWIAARNQVRWGPQLDKLYGLDHGRQSGTIQDFLAHLHPEDAPRVEQEIQAAMAEHRPELVQEFRILRADGEVRWIEARTRLFYRRKGAPKRAVGANIDVTERRLRELERERLIESERASHAEAERARKALLASNEDLERFAYAVSHDFQQPLRTIRIFTELLGQKMGGRMDEEARGIAQAIVNGVERMRALMDGLLAFSRANHGAPEAAREVDANAVLEQALEHLRAAVIESAATVTADHLPPLRMGDQQLLQVFLNLLGNALKYRSREAPRIHVAARDGGAEWVVAVSDNGMGIDPRDHQRIFGAFQRLPGSEEREGVGLGLALVRRVVERHGGQVRVESETGKGATFSFTVPKQGDMAASARE